MEDWDADLSPCNFVTTHFPAERSSFITLSHCNFATTHLTACILDFYLPSTSRPMKRRTLSQRPNKEKKMQEDQGRISQHQSITQKGVHTQPLTAREREHWFLQHLMSHFIAVDFGGQ